MWATMCRQHVRVLWLFSRSGLSNFLLEHNTLPGLTPLDVVDGGAMHPKLTGNLGHRLTTGRQLALDLQHLALIQRSHTTLPTAGLRSLTLRLRLAGSFLGSGQCGGLLRCGQIQLNVLSLSQRSVRLDKSLSDELELVLRKNVHVHRSERVQCSTESPS